MKLSFLCYIFNFITLLAFFSCFLARDMSEDQDPRDPTSHGSIFESFCQDLLLLKGSLRPFARFPTLLNRFVKSGDFWIFNSKLFSLFYDRLRIDD